MPDTNTATNTTNNTSDTLIDLFRHGKVDGPAAMYGTTDVPLHGSGWVQLEAAVDAIDKPETIITSPRQRCHLFAEDYAARLGLPLVVEPGLQEYDFGDWDGVPFDELFGCPEENPAVWAQLQAFADAPKHNPVPNGEAIDEVFERVSEAFDRLAVNHQGKHLAVFCHGAVIRLILGYLLPVNWHEGSWYSALSIGYGSRTRIRIPGFPGARPVVETIGWLPAGAKHISNPEGTQ